MVNHWGFSPTGCGTCDCDSRGSVRYKHISYIFEIFYTQILCVGSVQCDQLTGQCQCAGPQVEGRRCERCEENTRTRHGDTVRHCEPCPQCYNLVQVPTFCFQTPVDRIT